MQVSNKSHNLYPKINETQNCLELDSLPQLRSKCGTEIQDYCNGKICGKEKISKYMVTYVNFLNFLWI